MKTITMLVAASALSMNSVAETDIKFALDWKFEGPAAAYLLALEKGYYKEEGLNVTIDSGSGSLEAIPRVATNTYQMGFADINSLIKFVDKDPQANVEAVMMIYDNPAFAIIGRKSLGVTEPKDLEGKTLGAPAPDGAYANWPVFVHETGINEAVVTIENIGFPVREPMLAQGKVDAITGFSFSSYINLKSKGVPESDITTFLMSDYGVDLYGNAILVNLGFAQANPEAVKGFIRATIKGFKETVADPESAIKYVLKYNDIARENVELERLKMALRDNILTGYVAEHGIGGIDEKRMENAIEQLSLTYNYQQKPSVSRIFNSTYLPAEAARKID